LETIMKLETKVAVVTGASKGIGAAIAKHLAAEGASVVVNYVSSREGADRVVAEITAAGGKAVAVQANVAHQADIVRLFQETIGAYGKLDILINNAGIYEFLPLSEITPEHFHRQYDLNVLGLILTTQEAVKHIGPDGGAIVNMSSVVSTLSPAGSAVYNSTKSAVDGLTRSFAKELAPRKIRVNSINPGLVMVTQWHHLRHWGVWGNLMISLLGWFSSPPTTPPG
jgi:3-oxoacyl-[acyl-carrier protein] reductase